MTPLEELLSECKHRNDYPELLNQAGLTGFAIEIGAAEGGYSEWIRKFWNGQKLYLVDPWMPQPVEDYIDGCNGPQSDHDTRKADCYQKMSVYNSDSYEIIQAMSPGVADRFPDDYFDFVYIDGNHNEHAVRADIAAWFPKVKPGGILAGHDYVPVCPTYGVQTAVNEFCEGTGKHLFIIPAPDYGAPSWAVIV